MLVTLVAPEFIAAKALVSYRSARLNYPSLRELADEDAVPWSMAHTFLADMGGLVIYFPESCHNPCEALERSVVDGKNPFDVAAISAADDEFADPGSGRNMPAHKLCSTNVCSDRHDSSAQNHEEVPRIEPITVSSDNDGKARTDDIAFAPNIPAENSAARDDPNMPDSISPAHGEGQMNDETNASAESENMPQAKSAHPPKLCPRPGRPQESMAYDCTRENTPAISHNFKPLGTQYLNRVEKKFRLNQEKAAHKYGASTWRLHEYNASLGQAILSEDPPYRRAVLWKIIQMEGNIWVLNSTQLQYARACGIISKLHSITEDELDDKGKGDIVAKVLALFQVTRMIIQLAVRAATPDKPSAPLEVATVAFAVLAFVTYLLLFKHPQDLQTPLHVTANRLPTIDEFRAIAIMSPDNFWCKGVAANEFIPNNTYHRRGGNDLTAVPMFLGGGIIGGFLFGSIHLFAWNCTYPTDVERLLWISSSFITALVPLLASFVLCVFSICTGKSRGHGAAIGTNRWLLVVVMAGAIVFLIARVFLLVEMLRSLYYLPPGVFLKTWTTNIPHIGG